MSARPFPAVIRPVGRLRRLSQVVSAASLGLYLACLPTGPQPGSNQSPATAGARQSIVAGAIDSGHAAVVAIGSRRTDCGERLAPHCSGTLIAPRIVLTAAHCVTDAAFPDHLEVLFGASVSSEEAWVLRVSHAELHPSYRRRGVGRDLALLVLADAVDSRIVPPLPLNFQPRIAVTVGAVVTVVGFGQSDAQDAVPGHKRSGTARVAAVQDQSFRIVKGPALTCHGDSGGPVLMAAEGQEFVVGIATAGDPGCLDYGDNLRVEASLETFLAPFLAPGARLPTEPSSPSAAPSTEDAQCAVPCDDPHRCPAGLICQDFAGEGEPMRRCTLPGLLPGRLGERCTVSSLCPEPGARCVRLQSRDSTDACRCYQECDPSASPGCATLPPAAVGAFLTERRSLLSPGGLGLAAFGLLLLTAVRARGRRRCGR